MTTATTSPSDPPRYWQIEEVCAYLKVCKRTVERLGIPYARIGRKRYYRPSDVVEYVEAKIG